MSKSGSTDDSRLLLVVSAALGLSYGFGLLPADTQALAMLSKGSCVGLLALYAALHRNFMLAVALAFGTAGDVFLASQFQEAFMLGLSAFLIGHLVYIWIIWPARISWAQVSNIRWTAIGMVAGLGLLQGAYLLPHVWGLDVPVVIYTAILMVMTALAIASSYPLHLVALGAALFFLSDLVLGLSFFSPDIDVPRWLNWFLYYPGQLLLAVGLVGGVPEAEAR